MSLTRRSFVQFAAAAAAWPITNRRFHEAIASDKASLCHTLANDPLRPQYHLLPAHNWMNDPNGPIFWRGQYHMFHQYNPQAATWGNMNWAHATSPNMIHWKHQPIALSPTPGGPDQDGVFSGSAVVDRDRPTLIYTGVAPPSASDATLRDGVHVWRETQCLALAKGDDLNQWEKLPDPVIAAPPEGLDVTGFRDPALWREGDYWMLILGSGIRGKGGAVLLYSSTDLRHWKYLHPLVQGKWSGKDAVNAVDTGDMWECPDFFPLGNKHVLLVSTMGKVRWKVGSYENQRFTAEKEGVVDWGSYYAAKTMVDRNGRRILWGWITETRADADLIAAGWAGAMSLPRVLSLSKENELQMDVATEAHSLRSAHMGSNESQGSPMRQRILDEIRIHDLAAELDLELQPKNEFTLRLLSRQGELTSISCRVDSGARVLRLGQTSCPLPGAAGSSIRLHIFLDGSILEVFANQTVAVTARVYKPSQGPLRLKLDGEVNLRSIDTWQMTPISRHRLTESFCGE